jgi:hypothetical protein
MTEPQRRRPLPALAFIGALCLLTAIVWFRVIHRSGSSADGATPTCPGTAGTVPSTSTSPTAAATAAAKVVPPVSSVSVLVLNSTQRNGLATATKKTLQNRGFRVTQATDDGPAYGGHGPVRGVAEIRYGPSGRAAATLLSFYFPHATLTPTKSASGVVAVALGAKFRAVASTKAAQRAMVAAHVRTGHATPTTTPSPTASC